MIRPTPRRNGLHMATIRTETQLRSGQIASILAGHGDDRRDGTDWDDRWCADLTRATAERLIRAVLTEYGTNATYSYWADELYPAEAAERATWAARQVQRLWPAMHDHDLADFLRTHGSDPDTSPAGSCPPPEM